MGNVEKAHAFRNRPGFEPGGYQSGEVVESLSMGGDIQGVFEPVHFILPVILPGWV